MAFLSTLLPMVVLKVLARSIMALEQENEIKELQIRNEEVSFFITGDAILHIEKP